MTRIRLPREPITLGHLETNLQGSLLKLAHNPRHAYALVEQMMKLCTHILNVVEREVRGVRLDAQQRRAMRRAPRRTRAPATTAPE